MRAVATIVTVIVMGLSLGLLAAGRSHALSEIQTVGAASAADAAPRQVRRARTKVLVRPVYPHRHWHSVYPVPYRFDYPGPNAKRDCTAYYVEEHRPSGTVVTPRMRCRWVRG